MYPNPKKTSLRPGSVVVNHYHHNNRRRQQQQSRPSLRYQLMVVLILFMFLIPLFFFFFANILVTVFPPPSCFNSLRRRSTGVPSKIGNSRNGFPSKEKLITVGFCRRLIDGTVNASTLASKEEEEEEEDGSHVGGICCDRTHNRTDICYMKGDVRTSAAGNGQHKPLEIFLYNIYSQQQLTKEKIKPYTRKWEESVMSTIDELTLVPVSKNDATIDNGRKKCDVHHKVPGVALSVGGRYTGNVYHDFNDGLIPLYLTTERFNGEVVLLLLEHHSWWMSRYENVVKKISNYEIIKLDVDRRVHCFPEMIVGLKIHGELSIDPQLMPNGIQNFQALLYESFGTSRPTVQTVSTQLRSSLHVLPRQKRPKLTMLIRKESRVILNLRRVIKICKKIGFQVKIIAPGPEIPLSEIHIALSTSDVMVAVHGAAMTHFMFVRPGSILLQIVPLGLNWGAGEYYGTPAKKLGLEYVEYRIDPSESSLSKKYSPKTAIISNPKNINRKGWDQTKKIYLGNQNITLNVKRFGNVISRVYKSLVS